MSTGGWFEPIAEELLHDGHVRLRRITLRGPDGATFDRDVATPPDAVAVVAELDGDVVLVRQHRAPAGASLLELPAGVCDVDGESPVEVAARELAEEVSLGATGFEVLTTLRTSPGWSTEQVTIVLATGVHPVDRPQGFTPEAEEAVMEVVRLPWEAVLGAVQDGTITDAKTVAGVLLAAGRRAP